MTAQIVIFLLGCLCGAFGYWFYSTVPPTSPELYHTLLIAKDDLYNRACILIREAEGLSLGTSGEYKRWTYVMQKLGREFPDRVKEFGVVIEAALRNQK